MPDAVGGDGESATRRSIHAQPQVPAIHGSDSWRPHLTRTPSDRQRRAAARGRFANRPYWVWGAAVGALMLVACACGGSSSAVPPAAGTVPRVDAGTPNAGASAASVAPSPAPTRTPSPEPTAAATATNVSQAGTSSAGTTGVPDFSHVYVIVMENREYDDIVGSSKAPYI